MNNPAYDQVLENLKRFVNENCEYFSSNPFEEVCWSFPTKKDDIDARIAQTKISIEDEKEIRLKGLLRFTKIFLPLIDNLKQQFAKNPNDDKKRKALSQFVEPHFQSLLSDIKKNAEQEIADKPGLLEAEESLARNAVIRSELDNLANTLHDINPMPSEKSIAIAHAYQEISLLFKSYLYLLQVEIKNKKPAANSLLKRKEANFLSLQSCLDLENGSKSKQDCLINLKSQLKDALLKKDNFTHRDNVFFRYIMDVLSVLTLVRPICTYVKYGTLAFWQPRSQIVLEAANRKTVSAILI